MNRALCAMVLAAVGVPVAFADGLIWQLPPDGTTVEFKGDCHAEFKRVLSKEVADTLPPKEIEKVERLQKVTFQATVTVSSVGQVTRAEQKCRWIELATGENVLKILVPEKFLTRGEDPLDHAVLTFFNPKGVDRTKSPLEKGFNRIAYELDRFRGVFPLPLREVQKLPKKTIKTPIGTFTDCEVIAGTTEFDRPLLAEGRWEAKSSWQIALHPDAPFGVVQLQCQATVHEFTHNARCDISTTSVLTISSKGSNAKSKLARDAGVDGGASSDSPSVNDRARSPSPKDSLAALLLQEAVQKELNLSQDQIARVRQIDEGLRQPTSPKEAQDPRREENARRQLEENLSPEQVKRLFRIVLRKRRSDPTCGLYNPWIADRLELTPDQRKSVTEIRKKVMDRLQPVAQQMRKAARSENHEAYEKANGQISKIVEDARKETLKLLTAGQRAAYDELKGKEPEVPFPSGR
jgi:desulfoferrodoxin (superoxide reductase-like protein)